MAIKRVVISNSTIMLPADAQAYNRLRSIYAPFYAKLDNDAKHALNAYGSGNAWRYNEHMRSTEGKPTDEFKEFDEALRRALSCVLPVRTQLYRGLHGRERVTAIASSKMPYIEHQPLSATLSSAVAMDFGTQGSDIFMSHIYAEKGVKFGMPVHDFEAEFLFKQDTMFKAVSSQETKHGRNTFHVATIRAIRTLR